MDTNIRKRESGVARIVTLAILLCLMILMQTQLVHAASKPIQGIDVSQWQESINWKKVKKSGIEFAMIGTGRFKDGVATPDPAFTTNIKGALNAGVNVGVYHYLTATTVSDAEKAANYVLSLVNGYKISYPIAVDIEDDIYKSLSKKKRTDLVIAFLDVIVEAGYYPAVYASDDYFVNSLDTSRLEKKGYDFWVAAWTKDPVTTPMAMWQYEVGKSGSVSGISTDVDMDYSYKDYASIYAPRYSPKMVEAGWYTDGSHSWYVNSDGSIPKSTFLKIGSKTYYVDKNGYRVTGWQTISGKCYNFKKTGVMRTGWYTSSGKKYYLDPNTGERAAGKTEISGETYYFKKSTGVMRTGWVKSGGEYYYFSKNTGAMQTGWQTIKGKRYYLDPGTGARVTGWLKIKKKTYYLSPSTGNVLTGWQEIDGKQYYFSKKKGIMRTGWRKSNGARVYLDPETGARVTGWQEIDGKWYYFKKSTGAMQKNKKIGEYVLGSDGVCTNR